MVCCSRGLFRVCFLVCLFLLLLLLLLNITRMMHEKLLVPVTTWVQVNVIPVGDSMLS